MRRLNAYAKVVSSENNVRKVLGRRGGDRRFNLKGTGGLILTAKCTKTSFS